MFPARLEPAPCHVGKVDWREWFVKANDLGFRANGALLVEPRTRSSQVATKHMIAERAAFSFFDRKGDPVGFAVGRAVVLGAEPDGLGPSGFRPCRETRPPAPDELR